MLAEFFDATALRVGSQYSRKAIAHAGLVSERNFAWPTGITEFQNYVLLFVTLEKTIYAYRDQFDGSLFWWQSQTTQIQSDKILVSLAKGEREALLFVRIREKGPRTLPFTYCGRLSRPIMTGEKPVTCQFESLDFVEGAEGPLREIYAWRPTTFLDDAELDRRRHLEEIELSDPKPRGQGRVRDVQRRRAIERHAMNVAKAHYADLGYSVVDTSSNHPYDLTCHMNGLLRRVEVKGTQTQGSTVQVTIGEVVSARNANQEGYITDLFVVHSILVTGTGESLVAVGGAVNVVENWSPSDASLDPIAFRHVVRRP